IVKGDVFDLVYLPARGVTVLKNGQRVGAIQGLAFKQALFGIWLSNRPADESLRVALLGK
ncbi:MAG TPA: chalcone isomerase family protein, partial [Lacipirellulaceae bacterium]|nr:chalcone isomerase family protein [Lacipirellulaceae bacterium]